MGRIPHYPKIWNLGNDHICELFSGPVEITEKVDGSQFGFGIDSHDELMFRSKGCELFTKEQNGMFATAITQIEQRKELLMHLRKNYALSSGNPDISLYFYGEYLNKPKHNVLKYDRTPNGNIILFGVKIGENFEYNYEVMRGIATFLDLETVPLIHSGLFDGGYEKMKEIITTTQSALGGTIIEGIVIKNYTQICSIGAGTDPQFGKYVREDFKEALHKEWGTISGKNSLQEFIDGFRAEPRWLKAVQHLQERGELENSPRDIGKLIIEVKRDITEECTDPNCKGQIENFLKKYFLPDIYRRACAGLPEWYKDQLMKKQFEGDNDEQKS